MIITYWKNKKGRATKKHAIRDKLSTHCKRPLPPHKRIEEEVFDINEITCKLCQFNVYTLLHKKEKKK